jgi:putative spermidine/putrescine transport system permease protein
VAKTRRPAAAAQAPRDWGKVALYVVSGLVLAFLLLPILVVIPMSFSSASTLVFPPPGWSLQWYARYLGSPVWRRVTLNSITVALTTMGLASALGTPAAFAIVRGRFPGRNLLYAFVISPIIVPAIITAISIYSLYSRLHLVGSFYGLAIAHTVLATPFVVVNVSAVLRGFDRSLEWAAASLGANAARTFWHVTLPIIRPGLIAGALFAFITSFDEVVIAIFIAGTTSSTLPKRMWESIRLELDPIITAVSALLILFSILMYVSLLVYENRAAHVSVGAPGELQEKEG